MRILFFFKETCKGWNDGACDGIFEMGVWRGIYQGLKASRHHQSYPEWHLKSRGSIHNKLVDCKRNQTGEYEK